MLIKLQLKVTDTVNHFRAVHRYITSDVFIEAFAEAPSTEQTRLLHMIDSMTMKALRTWVKKYNLDALDVSELRIIAKSLNIPIYYELGRQALIVYIRRERDRQRDRDLARSNKGKELVSAECLRPVGEVRQDVQKSVSDEASETSDGGLDTYRYSFDEST